MTDLTKITTPFGLLDAETQQALKNYTGTFEVWTSRGWTFLPQPSFDGQSTYRAQPEPPKPREFWVIIDPNPPHFCHTSAESALAQEMPYEIVHVREVLP